MDRTQLKGDGVAIIIKKSTKDDLIANLGRVVIESNRTKIKRQGDPDLKIITAYFAEGNQQF